MKITGENIISPCHRPSGRPSVPHLKALKPSGIGNYSLSPRSLSAEIQLNAHGFRNFIISKFMHVHSPATDSTSITIKTIVMGSSSRNGWPIAVHKQNSNKILTHF